MAGYGNIPFTLFSEFGLTESKTIMLKKDGVCVCVFLLACSCFDSPEGPTVLCHVWELSCHECDPINTDHIFKKSREENITLLYSDNVLLDSSLCCIKTQNQES